eukprot:13928010-Heterocapsa_arctica.AAC.1
MEHDDEEDEERQLAKDSIELIRSEVNDWPGSIAKVQCKPPREVIEMLPVLNLSRVRHWTNPNAQHNQTMMDMT